MAEQWQATCLASEQALSGQPLLLRRQGLSTATVRPPQLLLRVAADPRLKPRPSQSSSGFRRLTTSRFQQRQQGQRPLQKLLVCGWNLRNTVPTPLERHGELCVRLSPLGASRTKTSPRGDRHKNKQSQVCDNGHKSRGHKSQSTAPGEGGEAEAASGG